MNANALSERIARVRARVAEAAARSGRTAADVEILPITKGHPPDLLRAVAEAGFAWIGENRVGEAERKRDAVGDLGVRWHMVGHVQRNKAARAVRLFDCIESVDSLRLAHRLADEVERSGLARLPVLVQVNASGEEAKSGFAVEGALAGISRIHELPGLDVRGLMTMAPYTEDVDRLRATFRRTAECLRRCRERIPGFEADTLSMGMSNDFELAIEEGSTEVRLGTILVGERPER